MEGVELTKAKYTHSGDTLRNPLNIDFGLNNQRQNYKTGSMCGGYLWEGGG
jgi:hypothetical protein